MLDDLDGAHGVVLRGALGGEFPVEVHDLELDVVEAGGEEVGADVERVDLAARVVEAPGERPEPRPEVRDPRPLREPRRELPVCHLVEAGDDSDGDARVVLVRVAARSFRIPSG